MGKGIVYIYYYILEGDKVRTPAWREVGWSYQQVVRVGGMALMRPSAAGAVGAGHKPRETQSGAARTALSVVRDCTRGDKRWH